MLQETWTLCQDWYASLLMFFTVPLNLCAHATIPRDVICRIHHFLEKELIMKRDREAMSLDFDGAVLTFYPDLARETLE